MKKLLLIDGHSILNRAFFGLPDLTNSFGEHTGAVYGFLSMMFKFMELENPTHITVAFDMHAPTFRHKMFDAYKGTRKPMAPELKEQVPRMQELLKAMNIKVVTKEGYEADDILGTLARLGEEAGFEVTIVSGDRDLLQLATEHVKISIPKTKKTGTEIENYFAADVKEAYSVTPKQFIDVKALQGDTADNIPGVEGIGEKTAQALIAQYGSIEECYAHVEELKPPRASKNLAAQWDIAQLSKTLATINTQAPVEFDEENTKAEGFYTKEAYALVKRYEFKKLLSKFDNSSSEAVTDSSSADFEFTDDAARITKIFEEIKAVDDYIGVELVLNTSNQIWGAAVCYKEKCCVLKCGTDFTATSLFEALVELSAGGSKLVFLDLKRNMHALYDLADDAQKAEILSKGAKAKLLLNADDITLVAYLLDASKGDYPVQNIAADALEIMIPSFDELFGKTKLDAALADDAQIKNLTTYFGYCAYVAKQSFEKLFARLDEANSKIYSEIELPLLYTLFDMEIAGIAMDADALVAFGERLKVRILELEKEIYSQAGEEFNINSPKQLGVILFEKLGIEGGKKTKTGYSTAADILEELATQNPIIKNILEYRQLAKLKSTYVDGLSTCNQADGRVHSTFMQTVTATGRISSTEPNLQNIPIRMELGREIRKVFLPKEGFVFLDADYSQIELRVLAHMSEDENLIDAFRKGQDIHRSTASLVFNTPFEEVTDLQRRSAKAVNFGIVYGISAFGLAKDIGIGRKEAQEYINNYFVAYPKMHDFLEGLKETAKEQGFVSTMYGRRRYIKELSSSNFMQRQFGERIAMNSPIQGTAADIIKIAMVKVHDRLLKEGLESKLLLQVHDELLIETKVSEQVIVEKILSEEMENAAKLSVKLEIDMHAGSSWFEAK